jgi:hypothetical protein
METGGPHQGHRASDIAINALVSVSASAAAKPRAAIRFPFLIVRPRVGMWAVRHWLAPDNEMPLDPEVFNRAAKHAENGTWSVGAIALPDSRQYLCTTDVITDPFPPLHGSRTR